MRKLTEVHTSVLHTESIGVWGEPPELKHLSIVWIASMGCTLLRQFRFSYPPEDNNGYSQMV